MKKIFISLLVISAMPGICGAQIRFDMDYFISLFNQGKYAQVYNEACALRNKKEDGKILVLDYFIAKSLCGKGSYELAMEGFEYIKRQRSLTADQKKYVDDEAF